MLNTREFKRIKFSSQYLVRVPNEGGVTNLLDGAEWYLDKYFPGWKDNGAVTVPVLVQSEWESATGSASGSLRSLSCFSTEEGKRQDVQKIGLAKGSRSEAEVFYYLIECWKEFGEAILILNSLKLEGDMVEIVNYLAETDFSLKPTFPEVADIIVLSKSIGICLYQVKSCEEPNAKYDKAIKQLKSQDLIDKLILKIGCSCPIYRVCALPRMSAHKIPEEKRKNNIIYQFREDFQFKSGNILNKFKSDNLSNDIATMTQQNYQMLLKLLFIPKVLRKSSQPTHNIQQVYISREKANKECVESLTSQNFLSNAYDIQIKAQRKKIKAKKEEEGPGEAGASTFKDTDKKLIEKRPGIQSGKGLFNLVIFLTPEQLNIMYEPRLVQKIIGYAGTGKTVLIQNKVLEILKLNLYNENILIVVPHMIVSIYNSFFSENLDDDALQKLKSNRNLVITTLYSLSTNFSDLSLYHIFIDEISIAIETSLRYKPEETRLSLKLLLDAARSNKNERMHWRTLDYAQHQSSASPNAQEAAKWDDDFDKLGVTNFLYSSLRSSQFVFDSWRNFSGGIALFSGNNILGHPFQRYSKPLNEYTFEWAFQTVQSILVELRSDGWKYEDIAILVETNVMRIAGPLPEIYRKFQFTEVASDGVIKPIPNSRCQERYNFENSLTVDTANMTNSHEWPVVITVMDNFVTESWRYISRSRCLVKLLCIEPNFETSENLDNALETSAVLTDSGKMAILVKYGTPVMRTSQQIKEFSLYLKATLKNCELRGIPPSQYQLPEELLSIYLEKIHSETENFHRLTKDLVCTFMKTKHEGRNFFQNLLYQYMQNYYIIIGDVKLIPGYDKIFNGLKTFSSAFNEKLKLILPEEFFNFGVEESEQKWKSIFERYFGFNFDSDFSYSPELLGVRNSFLLP